MSKSQEGNPLLVTQTDLACADGLSSRLQFSNAHEIWISVIVHWLASNCTSARNPLNHGQNHTRVSNSENSGQFLDMGDINGDIMGIPMDTAPSRPSAASSLAAGPGASSFRPEGHSTRGPVNKFFNQYPAVTAHQTWQIYTCVYR